MTPKEKIYILRELYRLRDLIEETKPKEMGKIYIYFNRIMDLLEVDIEDINDSKLEDKIVSLHERL